MNKKYWKGLEELHQTEAFQVKANKEFSEEVPVEEFLSNQEQSSSSTSRRDFLKFMGFSITAATVAACEAPVIKSIPYVNKPEDITPGVANFYASSFYDGFDFANVMVKTREGRPIHIKGNKNGFTKGAVNARINASVLNLYNTARVQQPQLKGEATTWGQLDAKVVGELEKAVSAGKKVALVSNSIISPSANKLVAEFAAKYNGEGESFNHVTIDANSFSAIREAHESHTGKAIIPFYDFAKAKTLVAVNADFLNDWVYPAAFTKGYAELRNPESGLSKHYQIETTMSLSGSNADVRMMMKPSEEGLVVAAIYNHIAAKAGASSVSVSTGDWAAKTKKVAEDLWSAKGASLFVSGSKLKEVQELVVATNKLLGNYGSTLDTNQPINLGQQMDSEVSQLIADMNSGAYGAVIIAGTNPAYYLANGDKFLAGLKKVAFSVAIAEYADETAANCTAIAPDHNYLESWKDAEARVGELSLTQPAINPLYKTRQFEESLLAWMGSADSFHAYMKKNWQENIFAATGKIGLAADFWHQSLHDGVAKGAVKSESLSWTDFDASATASAISKLAKPVDGIEVKFYHKVGIGSGAQAANPWLQEMPDPISKVTWDNYVTMAPSDVEQMGLNGEIGQELPASLVTVSVNGNELKLPVFPQPGQTPGTIGIALGYGRGANGENIGKSAFQTGEYGGYVEGENGNKVAIGKRVVQMAAAFGATHIDAAFGATVAATGEEYPLACTQTHHTVMGRESVVKETTLGVFQHGHKHDYNHGHTLPIHTENGMEKVPVSEVDLWDAHPVEGVGHRWGMSIDLSTCIGCGSCITACHSENNVPVVGKDEIRRSRDMHWMRIDRYFSSAEEKVREEGGDFSYGAMEIPEQNPSVVHMPMMCQHCNHAPCETVCPVAATTHSNEGLNQMTYNRCIGTRYCANNCPYKVRRFNWFNYKAYKKFTEVNPAQDEMGRMVLNPDVTVRSRGVMEKCSLCVQRIQAGKLDAKKAGRPVKDGEVQSACAEACPTDAIVFGDLNDKNSRVRKLADGNRAYNVLEEVGTRPNIYYQVKVRNAEQHSEA
ncbi:TAT-variant-translocated molybdopterin oxidoreductase [Luteibaculum oceani]|nr:TAT-variant-translocated molybdopterin oxidoreductase [Luteibaculum oceani]